MTEADYEKRLLRAIISLKNNSDFAYVLGWLYNTKAEYLKLLGDSKRDKIEHFQGRYKALEDLLIYLGLAEQKLTIVLQREKEKE